jgi:hypothetical protein
MPVGYTINFMVLTDLLQCGVTPYTPDAGGLKEKRAVDDIGTVC